MQASEVGADHADGDSDQREKEGGPLAIDHQVRALQLLEREGGQDHQKRTTKKPIVHNITQCFVLRSSVTL